MNGDTKKKSKPRKKTAKKRPGKKPGGKMLPENKKMKTVLVTPRKDQLEKLADSNPPVQDLPARIARLEARNELGL